MFGPLSGSFTVWGLDVELVYVVGLVLLALGFDPFTAVVVGVLLALYQNAANSANRRNGPAVASEQAPSPAPNRSGREQKKHLGSLSDVRQDKM